MRIDRPEQNWCIVLAGTGERVGLERLALRCGYRICEMCAELVVSERYMHRIFVRDIGLAPKEWMRRERMVVARRKLIGGRRPEEVAAGLGFSNPNNFRREFLAVYKVPPVQFQMESWGLGDEWRRTVRDSAGAIPRMPVPLHHHPAPPEWGAGKRAD